MQKFSRNVYLRKHGMYLLMISIQCYYKSSINPKLQLFIFYFVVCKNHSFFHSFNLNLKSNSVTLEINKHTFKHAFRKKMLPFSVCLKWFSFEKT